ncbi:MAG: YihY/virulence factor BrkB family protein [Acidobacteriota bacterium]|nr:YihY/virulence factor BrkB family protein [Acidobacteriota bacterium]
MRNLPLSWTEIFKRTFKSAYNDNLLDLAAQQAYYFFFALFPAILTIISIASFFPIANLMDDSITMLGRVAPGDVLTIISTQMEEISESNKGGVLTFAFILTLWSTSGAMVSIITTLNAAYGITEGRPLWKVRLTALALTLGMSLFILISMALVLVGPTFAEHLATSMRLGSAFKWAWWILQWPVVFALVVSGIGIVYYFAPDAEQDWAWVTPGAILATVLWVLVSLAFKLYLTYFGKYNETYGAVSAFIVLLTWFYLSGLAIMVGAEMNAEIEHASPHGKNPGEKVPGEKKKIGTAAQRDYEARRSAGELVPVFPEGVNCDLDRGLPEKEHGARPSELLIGAAALLPAAIKIGREIKRQIRRKSADAG